jgi:2-isopropylmalate synthase
VTVGKDAQGEANVRVEFQKDEILTAKAASTDIVEAGAKAYLSCVNRHLAAGRLKKHPAKPKKKQR